MFFRINMQSLFARSWLLGLALLALLIVTAGCSSAQKYTVLPGDTLQSVAVANGITVSQLVDANKEQYPSLESSPQESSGRDGTGYSGW